MFLWIVKAKHDYDTVFACLMLLVFLDVLMFDYAYHFVLFINYLS